jgi:hypothetical protein
MNIDMKIEMFISLQSLSELQYAIAIIFNLFLMNSPSEMRTKIKKRVTYFWVMSFIV